MAYQIDTIPVHVTRFSGWLNLPKRRGDTEQTWPDDNGIDPFVGESDLIWEGLDLTVEGVTSYATRAEMVSFYQSIYNQTYKTAVSLTTPYGTYPNCMLITNEVLQYKGGQSTYKLIFHQPYQTRTIPTHTGTGVLGYGVDGFDLYKDFGIWVTGIEKRYDCPKLKEYKPTFYQTDVVYHKGRDGQDIVVAGYFTDYLKVQTLYDVLQTPGVHSFNGSKVTQAVDFYVREGCQVDWNGQAGTIKMNFRIITPITL